jgi:hypothetical protein
MAEKSVRGLDLRLRPPRSIETGPRKRSVWGICNISAGSEYESIEVVRRMLKIMVLGV